eukprot:4665-Heterococcus_DN1.PRE.3
MRACYTTLQYSAWVQSAGRTQALRSHCTATSSSSTSTTAAAAAAAAQQQSLALDYPSWFFLSHLSAGAKSLLSFLLHPDPRCRPSVKQAQAHPWLQPAVATSSTTTTSTTVSSSSAAMVSSSALSASVGSLSELVEIDSDDGESLCDDVTDDVVVTLPSKASNTTAAAATAGAGTGAGAVSATAAAGLTGITAAVDADVACATAVAGLIGELETAVAALALEPWIETAVAPETSQQQPLQAQALQTQTLQQLPLPPATAAVPSATATPANTPLQQPRHLSSTSSSGSGVTGSSSASSSGGGTGSGSTHQQQRRKLNTALFSSPPLAPRGSAATRERPPSPCAFSLSIGAGTPSPSTQSSRPFGFGLDTSSTDFTDTSSTTAITTAATSGDGELPPAFRDLVARSTRFCTDVPATEVLRKIAGIIDADAHPLPYPFRNITQIYLMRQGAQDRQQAHVIQSCLVLFTNTAKKCIVRLFNDDVIISVSDVVSGASRSSYSSSNSSRTGLYCVEFLRGQIDIFHFKRLYDGVRRQLSALLRVLTRLDALACYCCCCSAAAADPAARYPYSMLARSGYASLATVQAAATATPRLPTKSSASLPTQVLICWQPANTQGNYLCPETKLLRICVHGDETLCKLLVVIVAPNIVANHQAYSRIMCAPAFMIWSLVEVFRLYCGYFGNLREMVPQVSVLFMCLCSNKQPAQWLTKKLCQLSSTMVACSVIAYTYFLLACSPLHGNNSTAHTTDQRLSADDSVPSVLPDAVHDSLSRVYIPCRLCSGRAAAGYAER